MHSSEFVKKPPGILSQPAQDKDWQSTHLVLPAKDWANPSNISRSTELVI
jgi:hypothetical protein